MLICVGGICDLSEDPKSLHFLCKDMFASETHISPKCMKHLTMFCFVRACEDMFCLKIYVLVVKHGFLILVKQSPSVLLFLVIFGCFWSFPHYWTPLKRLSQLGQPYTLTQPIV